MNSILRAQIAGVYDNVKTNFTSKVIHNLKYAPIISVDVERSFFKYNNILTDRRNNFIFDHLIMLIVAS